MVTSGCVISGKKFGERGGTMEGSQRGETQMGTDIFRWAFPTLEETMLLW